MAESVLFQKLSLVRFLIARWICGDMPTCSDWNGTLKNIGSLRAYKKSRLLFHLEIRYRTHDIFQIVKSLTAPTGKEIKSNQITNNQSTRQNSRNSTSTYLQRQLKFAQNKRSKDHWTSNFHARRFVWRVIVQFLQGFNFTNVTKKSTWMKLTHLHEKIFKKTAMTFPWSFMYTYQAQLSTHLLNVPRRLFVL